jgi:hypothetical protein
LEILIYLDTSPNKAKFLAEVEQDFKEITTKPNNILLLQIPNPLESQNFTVIVDFLAQMIKHLSEGVK